ncbi:hypothetical protein SAMN04487944_1312 [Gracilibacillus ureilyticus]|uniref:Transposase n=1 Tax=Gracilibacillus ureilyticus TaxID=531814 RepID=A0A1H9VZW5_9BACI|nr:hypothetical protein [Gracilibacillus ureilyticus]SES27118.1 hypothetical protein SAMN04487944_1312 [Gracilibacillus ureilyticus]
MDHQTKLIELCKELRLPSIRKMVQDSRNFKDTAQAYEVLLQVLTQEQTDRVIRAKQNRIELRISRRKSY